MTGDDKDDGPTGKTAGQVPDLNLEFEEAAPGEKTIAEHFHEELQSYVFVVYTKDYAYNIFWRRPRVTEGHRHTAASARAMSAYLASAYLSEEASKEANLRTRNEKGYNRLEQIALNLRSGKSVLTTTVQDLLGWFDERSRSIRINRVIRNALLQTNLRAEPKLHGLALDCEIDFREGNFKREREQAATGRMQFEIVIARLGAWIDQNPAATESTIAAKKAVLDVSALQDLSSDESADLLGFYSKLVLGMELNDNHFEGLQNLNLIATSLHRGEDVKPIAVRDLLRWFGTKQRSAYANYLIRDALRTNNLRTEPDWNEQPLDGSVSFQEGARIDEIDVPIVEQLCLEFFFDRLEVWMDENPDATQAEIHAKSAVLNEAQFNEVPNGQGTQILHFPGRLSEDASPFGNAVIKEGGLPPIIESSERNFRPDTDPTYRIGQLPAAKVPPHRITRDDTIEKAIQILFSTNFQPLIVMNGERVIGAVSMNSIGVYTAQRGQTTDKARYCMESKVPPIVSPDTPFLEACEKISKHKYLLIRDQKNRIAGIVTDSDLNEAHRQLSEPWYRLDEIEKHIRRLIKRGEFTIEELRGAKDPDDKARVVNDESDLTFGEYIRLLEVEERWARLRAPIVDRKSFLSALMRIKRIRNDLFHFAPKGCTPEDLEVLRSFVEQCREQQHALLRSPEAC